MEVKQEYIPPQQTEVKKGFWESLFLGIFSLLAIPFKFLKKNVDLVKEDNAKIRKFKKWAMKTNARNKRAFKINDEF